MKKYIKYVSCIISLVLGLVLLKLFVIPSGPAQGESPQVKDEMVKKEVTESDILPIQETDETLKKKILESSEEFLSGYINYSREKPVEYVEKIKPFVTESFYEKHAEYPKREPLQVKEYKWDPDASNFSIAESVKTDNDFSVKSHLTVLVEVPREMINLENENILEDLDYWIEFQKEKGEWLVSEVNIHSGEEKH